MIAARKLHALVKETKKKEARRGLPPGEADEIGDDDDDEEEKKDLPKPAVVLKGDAAVVAKVTEKIKAGKVDDELKKLVSEIKESDEDEMPVAVENEKLWARALREVKKTWDDHAEPWVVVAHVYDELGGSLTA